MTSDITPPVPERHFDDWSKRYSKAVESFLKDWIATRLPGTPAILKEAMLYSLLAGGKRVRPLLVFGSCEALGGCGDVVLAAAAAVECVHTYSLIHDDLPAMDDDDLRRGKPTSHKVYGEALAILAGDALLTLAFEILGESYGDNKLKEGVSLLARGSGADGMVGGQTLDLIADGRIEPQAGDRDADDRRFLDRIHKRKTGALFASAVLMGSELAGPDITQCIAVSPQQRHNLELYSYCFGMAFQITDDLLDVQSDSASAGKMTGKDAGRGKLTYPGLLGVAEAEAEAEKFFVAGLSALEIFGRAGEPLRKLLLLLRNRKK